ncbi:MAG: hypothetical protein COB04_18335 [Gammaproteobacteria bacterium]|nr:MAG: hypothetical protein COB04_18335 [Gammaproteobacteria bacterium]
MTHLKYLLSRQSELTTVIINVGTDNRGDYAVLDETVFHRAGGGQKSDQGWINDKPVHDVRLDQTSGETRHYMDTTEGLINEQVAHMVLDQKTRALHSAYHSGGHLIALIIEAKLDDCRVTGGHHWPGEARLELVFDIKHPDDFASLTTQLQLQVDKAIAAQLRVFYHYEEATQLRTVSIGDYPDFSCGGTHILTTGELIGLTITAIKIRKGKVRLSYRIG